MISLVFDMMQISLSHVVILLFLRKSLSNETCSYISGQKGIIWPDTNTKTISSPLCINEKKEFVYRECTNGTWAPEPFCSYIQTSSTSLPICPDGYEQLGKICYILTPETTYPPPCPSKDTIPYGLYKLILSSDESVWLPIQRDDFGILRYTEISSSYKTEITGYDMDYWAYDLNCTITDGNKITATSCQNKFRGICAYQLTNHWVSNDFCDNSYCIQSDFFDKRKCVCVGTSEDERIYPYPEFLTLQENNIYLQMSDQNCTIGLEKRNGTYFWTNSMKEINYTFWADGVIFDEKHVYGAITTDGWILTEEQQPYFLYLKDVPIDTPTMRLEFSEGAFTLYVYNVDSLKTVEDIPAPVFCFTNADATSLLYRYSTPAFQTSYHNSTTLIVQFPPIGDVPGDYWCEGFKFDDLSIVKSNTVFQELGSDYFEFVMIVSYEYLANTDPLSTTTVSNLDGSLMQFFRNDPDLKENYTIRIMKFEGVDMANFNVFVNFHITSRKISLYEEYDFDVVKILLQDIVQRISEIQFVDFLSTCYCHEEEKDGLFWGKIPVGEKSSPDKYCFTDEGTPVERECGGNFMDGVRWSDYENCEIAEESEFSLRLIVLLEESIGFSDDDIIWIQKTSDRFTPLDIYLIAENFKKNCSSTEAMIKTINSLLHSSSTVLKQAQMKMKTTDTFLQLFENIFMYQKTFDFELSDLVFVSQNLTGMVVLENKTIIKLTGTQTIEDILKIDNLESAIWSLDQNQTIALSVFFNQHFFPLIDKFVMLNTIFGVFQNSAIKVNILHRLTYGNVGEFCTLWDYTSEGKEIWVVTGFPQMYSSFAVCEFYQPGYIGMTFQKTHDVNITDDLIDLLEVETVSGTLERLSEISERYSLFEPIDLTYVPKILQKVTLDEDVDLKSLTKIVSNLQKIDREVLVQSQKEERATDGILFFVDALIQMYKFEENVIFLKEHFLVLIMEVNDFYGLALFHRRNSLHAEVLNSTISFSDIVKRDDFDSLLFLDQDLKNLTKDSKLIVTVFSEDVLFNEKNPTPKNVSKVFGVILPQVESSPISILYKIDEKNNSNQCVHWNYTKSVSGFWKQDTFPKLDPGLAQCDFNHTTHFALLLVQPESFINDPSNILDIITTVNSVLSLAGLSCIILTAILFKKWRQNPGNQILLNFVVILVFQIIAFYVSGNIHNHFECYPLCVSVGVILHYCTISQFCWMLMVAFLQVRRLVIVLRPPPKNIVLKSCLCGWVLPIIPVVILLSVDLDSYVKNTHGLCYPTDWGLYLGVWLPVFVIIIINAALFVYILYNVIRKNADVVNVGYEEIRDQLRMAILLFFMFGLTWVFGFWSVLENTEVIIYLFSCTSTLQGFVIFLFFIVCNSNTNYLYLRCLKMWCQNKTKK